VNVITLDFETYYAKDYGLKKFTTEEYIRHPLFETIGVAVKVNDEPAVWFSGTKQDTKKFLDGFEMDKHLVVAHNALFDMAILNWHYDIRPKGIIDTLSMSRAIHSIEVGGSLDALTQYYNLGVKGKEVLLAIGKRRLDFTPEDLAEYGGYCINDVELTYKLFQVLASDFPAIELKLIDLTIRMFSEPALRLDAEALRDHLDLVKAKKERLMARIDQTKVDLLSNDKFAELLCKFNVSPPTKISLTTGKETFAFAKTDEAFKELLENENEYVQALVAARLGVKSTLEETRTQRFIEISDRGLLPIPLRYYAAHTGRWGGDDKVNLQNLPRSSALKFAIKAPEGYKIIDSDSSQIEARTLAWLSGQNDLVDAFEKGEDVYKIMASSIYKKEIQDITKDERFVGKTTILGAGYGMGAQKFQAQLKTFGVDVPLPQAQYIIQVYRETYAQIPLLWKQAGRVLDAIINNQTAPLGRSGVLQVEGTKGIRLPNGLYIKYPNLRKITNETGKVEYVYDVKKGRALLPNRIYGGKVIENVCQALARIAIGEQMLLIAKKYKVVMTVHDAIACIVPASEESAGKEFVELAMRIRPKWAPDLPLNCESGSGDSYGEC
jgi:DNA polymerase I-like protein with 3'-5' exonuclease and polymerase domains